MNMTRALSRWLVLAGTAFALVGNSSVVFATSEKEFPSYLNQDYCEDIASDFMTSTLKSLRRYRDTHLQLQSKRGMINTRNYILQRKDWLLECDNFLSHTASSRIFRNEKTTETIFEAMDGVSEELASLAKGVTYSLDVGQDSTTIAAEKFEQLFKLVDDHKTLLLLRGQFVQRNR